MSEAYTSNPKNVVNYILGNKGWAGTEAGAIAKIPGIEDYIFPTKVQLMPNGDTLRLEYNYLGKKRRTSKFKLSNITHIDLHTFDGKLTLFFGPMTLDEYSEEDHEYKYWLSVYV